MNNPTSRLARFQLAALFVFALVAGIAALVISPASADDLGPYTPRPTVYALRVLPADPTPKTVDIQVVGQKHRWHAARAIKRIDWKIPGIRVHLHGTCHRDPGAWCVRIRVVDRPGIGWWGLTTYTPEGNGDLATLILLNRAYGRSKWVVSHEFLHALGMEHHAGRGLLAVPTPSMEPISHSEVRALRRAYPWGGARW